MKNECLRFVSSWISKMISLTMCATLRQLSLLLDHENVNEIRRLDCTNRQLSLSCDRYTKLPSYVCSRARRKGITSTQKFIEIILYGYIHWSENLFSLTRMTAFLTSFSWSENVSLNQVDNIVLTLT